MGRPRGDLYQTNREVRRKEQFIEHIPTDRVDEDRQVTKLAVPASETAQDGVDERHVISIGLSTRWLVYLVFYAEK